MGQAEDIKMQELLRQRKTNELKHYIEVARTHSKNMEIINQVLIIFQIESRRNVRSRILDRSLEVENLVQHYTKIKLLIRRFDFGVLQESADELYDYIINEKISDTMLVYLIMTNMFHKERVIECFINMFKVKEGNSSYRTEYYKKILRGMKERK